jgi:hypothetical protein
MRPLPARRAALLLYAASIRRAVATTSEAVTSAGKNSPTPTPRATPFGAPSRNSTRVISTSTCCAASSAASANCCLRKSPVVAGSPERHNGAFYELRIVMWRQRCVLALVTPPWGQDTPVTASLIITLNCSFESVRPFV